MSTNLDLVHHLSRSAGSRPTRKPFRARLECVALEDRQLLSSGWAAHLDAIHGHRATFAHVARHHAGAPTSTTSTTDSGSSTTSTTNTTPTQAPQGRGHRGHQQSAPPQLSAQAKTDIQKLQTDEQAIRAKSQVTVAQMTALQTDLHAIQKAATTTASQTTIDAVKADLTAFAGTLPTDAQKTQLYTDFTAAVQNAGVTDTTVIDKALTDIDAIVTASGITADDLATIAADQKAIQADMTSSTSSSSNTSSTTTTQNNAPPMMGMSDLPYGKLLGTVTMLGNPQKGPRDFGGGLGMGLGGPGMMGMGGHRGGRWA